MPARVITRNSVLLALAAALVALLLAQIEVLTRAPIEAQQRAAESRALQGIVPAALHDAALTRDPLMVEDRNLLGLDAPRALYRARVQGQVQAVLVPARAPDGYSGAIDLIVGIDRAGLVTGVSVVAHRETPGLGDRIEARKSPWIRGFTGRSLGDPPATRWSVRKDDGDFDQLSGATISSRAVARAVARALQFAASNEAIWLGSPAAATEQDND
jgi:Na+-translocating ferredoxin:NAD+ oxidoreductase subunit G